MLQRVFGDPDQAEVAVHLKLDQQKRRVVHGRLFCTSHIEAEGHETLKHINLPRRRGREELSVPRSSSRKMRTLGPGAAEARKPARADIPPHLAGLRLRPPRRADHY